jgi:hypothetical protein
MHVRQNIRMLLLGLARGALADAPETTAFKTTAVSLLTTATSQVQLVVRHVPRRGRVRSYVNIILFQC